MGRAGQFVTREGGNHLHTELLEDLGGPDIQHMAGLSPGFNPGASLTYLLVEETVEDSHQQTLEKEGGQG